MKRITVGVDIDSRDAYCAHCGFPFNSGDRVYDLGGDQGGCLVCSEKCAESVIEEAGANPTE